MGECSELTSFFLKSVQQMDKNCSRTFPGKMF